MTNGYLIKGGQVYDGTGAAPIQADVRIRGESISEIAAGLLDDGDEVIDAAGLIVAPGLVDLHTHVYGGMGIYSVKPEEAGLKTGATALLDAGSAGSLTYGTFHEYVIPQAREEVYVLLNIAQFGVQGHPDIGPYIGDLYEIHHLHVPSAVQCIKKHGDRIIGMKVRLTAGLANDRVKNEHAGLSGAIEAAAQTGGLCMTHHVGSNIPLAELLQRLRPGDIYTHMYHPKADGGFTGKGGVPADVMHRARDRGIIFDVGHGVGSFAWRVAEPACQQHGFWPDTISTDIHQFNLHGPVFDMPTTMSKFLHLGMSLEKVIELSTSAPARAMGMADRLGRLQPGRRADVVLLRLIEGKHALEDVEDKVRTASQRLVPVGVFKRGVRHDCQVAEDVAAA